MPIRCSIVIAIFVTCSIARAQDAPAGVSGQFDSCLNVADTQADMRICADQELRRVDVELNDVYQRVLTAARKQEGPRAVEKIRVAERAWITYRRAFMQAMYPAEDKQKAYGSRFSTDYLAMQAALT